MLKYNLLKVGVLNFQRCKKNIKPNEVGFNLGNWNCSIEQCGILTCHNCLRIIQEEEGGNELWEYWKRVYWGKVPMSFL